MTIDTQGILKDIFFNFFSNNLRSSIQKCTFIRWRSFYRAGGGGRSLELFAQ
ncbi:hypothetical protein HanIR_Chr03g0142691 [Helianthus annuus]|nr:hypothetical protein HanIR_Chr03g0142691 [Helianthus annuus]